MIACGSAEAKSAEFLIITVIIYRLMNIFVGCVV